MKPPLCLATQNAGKAKEFRALLSVGFRCLIPGEAPCVATPPDVDENGETYYENSLKKALHYYRTYRVPVLADDTGIEVDALNGAPGVRSARFGSESMSWSARWDFLYKALEGAPVERWTARFRAVLCYFDGTRVPFFFEGVCEGRIHPQPRGGSGFGYDPVFFSSELGKTFGEASDVEKSGVSHRARAVRSFLKWSEPS